MEGAILAWIIISPVTCCIGLYKCFNHGQLPCIDNHNNVILDN